MVPPNYFKNLISFQNPRNKYLKLWKVLSPKTANQDLKFHLFQQKLPFNVVTIKKGKYISFLDPLFQHPESVWQCITGHLGLFQENVRERQQKFSRISSCMLHLENWVKISSTVNLNWAVCLNYVSNKNFWISAFKRVVLFQKFKTRFKTIIPKNSLSENGRIKWFQLVQWWLQRESEFVNQKCTFAKHKITRVGNCEKIKTLIEFWWAHNFCYLIKTGSKFRVWNPPFWLPFFRFFNFNFCYQNQ